MKKIIILSIALVSTMIISKAQTTAMQFAGLDCKGNSVNLFSDLDAGKAVILHFYMPSCGSCPPPAQKIQKMAMNINAKYPGKVKGYAFPFENSTTCSYSSNWVASNYLSQLYTAMDSGEAQVAHYGGFGMPTVVVLGGKDHKVLFSTLSFSTSDTTIMRDKILELLGAAAISDIKPQVSNIKMFPNPAKDKVQIELNLSQSINLKVEVLNILGEVVYVNYEGKVTPGPVKQEINTVSLVNGIYIIRVSADDAVSSYKFVVSH